MPKSKRRGHGTERGRGILAGDISFSARISTENQDALSYFGVDRPARPGRRHGERRSRRANLDPQQSSNIVQVAVAARASAPCRAIAAGGAGRAGRGIVMSTAQAAPSQSGELPKGITFTTLRRVDGYGLGVRTERGILDVVAAEKDFAAGVPTTITAVLNGTGDWQKLRFLADRAKASSSAERYFIAEKKAAFGPCVTDPEQKRKRIGAEFIAVFADEARKISSASQGLPVKFLVQGTLYPDVIESVSVKGPSATIKTHHNVGGLPADIPFSLIEPLRDLFKDEVRQIGRALGLPEEILVKHPFPGPGLAVRLLGEVTGERLETLRAADAVVVEEIRRAGLYEKVWQAFAVLLPVQSVGVMGDGRTYGYTIAVRVVDSLDAMTADWSRLPTEVLERISVRIVNEVPSVNRVVYDISSKPPSTIEWE